MARRTIIYVATMCAAMMFNVLAIAQEHADHEVSDHTEAHHMHHHQIGLVLGHAHISNGVHDGKQSWEVLPSFGLNYNYWFNETWAIGLHTDIVIETYEVERHLDTGSEEILERVTPIAPALMLGYKPHKHFGFLLGPGYELEAEENLFLVRTEVEYSIEVAAGLEFEAGIGYDFRVDAYDSWSMVLGICRSF